MHVSFDFDYTLAESSEGTVVCALYALGEMGYALPTSDAIRRTIGFSLEKTFRILTDDTNEDAAARFKKLFFAHADDVMLGHIHLYPEVPELLRRLKEEKHYVSIVSTKLKYRIEAALQRDQLFDLVDDIVGGGCVVNNKPHPEPLLLACQRSNVPATQTVYVGDSVSDGECAQRADVTFVAVLTGTTTAEELQEYDPTIILSNVGDLRPTSLLNRTAN